MPLTLDIDPDRGDKRDVHVDLYESEIGILDALCGRFRASRAAVFGALLRKADEIGIEDRVERSRAPRRGPKSTSV